MTPASHIASKNAEDVVYILNSVTNTTNKYVVTDSSDNTQQSETIIVLRLSETNRQRGSAPRLALCPCLQECNYGVARSHKPILPANEIKPHLISESPSVSFAWSPSANPGVLLQRRIGEQLTDGELATLDGRLRPQHGSQ